MTRRILLTADAVGGVWQYAVELAAALAPLGYASTIATLGPAVSAAKRDAVAAIPGATLVETGLPLDWMAPDSGTVEAVATTIAALAAREKVDLVQVNQPALASARFAMPVVAVAHSCVATWWAAVKDGPLPDAFIWQKALAARGLAQANAIVCPSLAFAQATQTAYALPARPLVVHNGRTPIVRARETAHDLAFTAGRLWDPGKDAATLDRAAARLGVPFKAAGPIAGPHGERVSLSHLDALGSVEDRTLAGLLSVGPVFVSASRYEPFGLAVLEAAGAGCALVLSDIPTFRELWDDAATFVTPGDAAGFTAAIEALIADPAFRAKQGECARLRAERFTPSAMAANMAAIYASVLTGDRKAAA